MLPGYFIYSENAWILAFTKESLKGGAEVGVGGIIGMVESIGLCILVVLVRMKGVFLYCCVY